MHRRAVLGYTAAAVARIDVVDPGPEGAALAEGLRAAGFEVAIRSLSDVVLTSADALVLAGDVEGGLEALRRLRDDGSAPGTPVVLLGAPVGTSHDVEGPAFGAQAVLRRPVALGRLCDALARILGQARDGTRPGAIVRPEPTLQLDGVAEDRGAHPLPVREPTLALAEGAEGSLPEAPTSSRTPPGTGTSPAESAAPGGPALLHRPVAIISERLRELLLAADRRAFPNHPAIDLALPGGDEPAVELVPAELLEQDDVPVELVPDEDPIDAFTFVGGPALPPAPPLPGEPASERAGGLDDAEAEVHARKRTAPGTPSSRSRRLAWSDDGPPPVSSVRASDLAAPAERNADPRREGATGVQAAGARASSVPPSWVASEWPDEDSVLGRVMPDGARRGSLAEGGALRLLLRVCHLGLDARISITPAAGDTLELLVGGGELLDLDGPVEARAVEILRRRGARLSAAIEPARALGEALDRGAITPFERDRALREARERLLCEVVAAPKAGFSLARLDPAEIPGRAAGATPWVPPLAAPLRLALFEAARRAIDPALARAILGGPVAIRRGTRFDALAAAAAIPSEIASLVLRHDGEPLERLLAEAPDEPGLLGLLCALVAEGALAAVAIPAPDVGGDDRARHARRLLEDAARLAEEGDYFALLGTAPDASDRDVFLAHRRRREQLAALALKELGLAGLEHLRREALDAIDEAYRVLSVPRWRASYAAALAVPPGVAAPAAQARLAGAKPQH